MALTNIDLDFYGGTTSKLDATMWHLDVELDTRTELRFVQTKVEQVFTRTEALRCSQFSDIRSWFHSAAPNLGVDALQRWLVGHMGSLPQRALADSALLKELDSKSAESTFQILKEKVNKTDREISTSVEFERSLVNKYAPTKGRLTKADNKRVRAGDDWFWLYSPAIKKSRHVQSPLFFPLDLTARSFEEALDDNEWFELSLKTSAVGITKRHLNKLQALFAKHSPAEDSFHDHVFCLLARYSALGATGQWSLSEGGQTGDSSLCQALPLSVMECLRKYFGCCFECFASPLDCHYARFCSLYPDVDSVFGSQGSFFNRDFTQGVYQAFPPPVPSVCLQMAQRLDQLLGAAGERPLFFIVFLSVTPHTKAAGRALMASPWLVRQACFDKQNVSLIPGNAYCYSTDAVGSQPFDLCVFFLQSSGARRAWAVTAAVLAELEAALYSRPGQEPSHRAAGLQALGWDRDSNSPLEEYRDQQLAHRVTLRLQRGRRSRKSFPLGNLRRAPAPSSLSTSSAGSPFPLPLTQASGPSQARVPVKDKALLLRQRRALAASNLGFTSASVSQGAEAPSKSLPSLKPGVGRKKKKRRKASEGRSESIRSEQQI